MTTCAHHRLRYKNVNFLCIHVKGLVTLKFILLHLVLVVFIITDNQDCIPEACVYRESHYNKCFLFTAICLSPTVSVPSHLLSYFYTAIFLTPSISFAFYPFILYHLYLCVYSIFIFAYNTENDLNLDRSYWRKSHSCGSKVLKAKYCTTNSREL